MLLLKPLWVYGSVGFLVACGRRQLSKESEPWGNKFFTSIFLLIVMVSVPIENWVLLRHLVWEMLFIFEKPSESMVTAASAFLQASTAVFSYWQNMRLLKQNGTDAVIRSSMITLSLFFAVQGLFYDSLMYSGTRAEYHEGVEKSFVSFFYTDRFKDAYVIYMLLFGPVFYYLAVTWNHGCTQQEKADFIEKLKKEVMVHAAVIYGTYITAFVFGLLPAIFGMERFMVLITAHLLPHALVIAPVYLCTTKEEQLKLE